MPKRSDLRHILLIGAGPIVIGQACEFDYSGTQAAKALRSMGYRVTLVNSNPATIMTDPEIADATYIEPITHDFLAAVIEKERPDAILPTMGGQTALNAAMELHRSGVLERYGVELIGARADVIDRAEDRAKFQAVAVGIGLEVPRSYLVSSLGEAMEARKHLDWPIILRPSYTLGGSGGGIAYNQEEFEALVSRGLGISPVGQMLLEESVIGWKEFEIEVVRDRKDNCIVVCSIENLDPMGVHTGDSITVAPILTLTDKEYQRMRDASVAVVRAIGVETGGCNVQFAVDPLSGRMVVIEVNPRVSRSSALASKATGFPIAKVAAQLAVGMTLDEILNEITGSTPASFEPTIDYVVVKVPRFDFEKFPGAPTRLNTAMKSVGEAMAMARSFKEALQKALCSLETGLSGLDSPPEVTAGNVPLNHDVLRAAVSKPSDRRLLWVAEAMRWGFSVQDIHEASGIDPWFLREISQIVAAEQQVVKEGLPIDRMGWMRLKVDGFSDQRLANLSGVSVQDVREQRKSAGIEPVFKRIDTCAAEFPSKTPYLYSTYEWSVFQPQITSDADPTDHPRKVVVLGGGPNRIGQGIEFDYCCVHAIMELRRQGCETIMVNCNPETVSTDYDLADRLYFEPLSLEKVLDILEVERSRGTLLGVLVQFGGQTPLKLSNALAKAGIPIMGTSPDSIDLAEDRGRFSEVLKRLDIAQPESEAVSDWMSAMACAERIGLPVLVRPSYVLGGRAMDVIYTMDRLRASFEKAFALCHPNPVLIDKFLDEAIELDVDAVSDGTNVWVAGLVEHVEQAGIHSGDSAGVLPSVSLSPKVIERIKTYSRQIAMALNVVGLVNIQYAVRGEHIYVLEANPRASRTVPFVAKALGIPLAKIAAGVMAGQTLSLDKLDRQRQRASTYFAVKEAVFPFTKLQCQDATLGPEMQSTGEVMGLDATYGGAFAKAQIAAGSALPTKGTVLLSVCDKDKKACVVLAESLLEEGFALVATRGTAEFLKQHGVAKVERINKVVEGSPHCVDAIVNRKVELIVNTTQGAQSVRDSAAIRMGALARGIPYTTTIAGAVSMVRAIRALRTQAMQIKSLQEYHAEGATQEDRLI